MKVSPAELTLYDNQDTIVIRPFSVAVNDEVICKSWNLGAPDVRVSSTERPGADGIDEGAGYLGARTVTLDLVLMGENAYATLDRLIRLTHPSRRPYLMVRRAAGPTAGQSWSIALRGNPYSIEFGRRAAALLELQLVFTAPAGYLLGPLQTFSTGAPVTVTATDWKFDAAFPHGFGIGGPSPTLNLLVGGSAPINPIIYITGPVTDPEVRTDDGERFKFAGLTLTAGQSVQIDMGAGTIRQANPDLTIIDDGNLYGTVDFSVSSFWQWDPGLHVFRYRANGGSATVQYRERRMSI